MNRFESEIQSFISRHHLLPRGARVVVAVSGGADSVALLTVLHNLGFDCIAAHCNFHLRGQESIRDMRHVQDLARTLKVDLYVKDFNVAGHMEQTGESVEMACRNLRYAWFNELLDKERARAVAVGQHREDQAETFMLNAVRTTGITGLTGMSPRNGYVIRPLLEASRSQIEKYLEETGVEFITDSTNALNDFKRNRLRNIALPALEDACPGAESGILATMANLADNKRLYDFAVGRLAEHFLDKSGDSIDIGSLKNEIPSELAPTLLFEMIRPRGFNMTQVRNILAATASATFFAENATAELSRGRLTLSRRYDKTESADEIEVSLRHDIIEPVEISISVHGVTEFKPERNPSVAYFDARILDGKPRFTLRHWRRGDRMKPYGMNGSKLLSDIFAGARLANSEKHKVWILTRDGEIVWVAGIRPSQAFSITPKTRFFLRLELMDKSVPRP